MGMLVRTVAVHSFLLLMKTLGRKRCRLVCLISGGDVVVPNLALIRASGNEPCRRQSS